MFRPTEILERIRERPFRPLRIIASEGIRFDIHHPDLVVVGQRDLMVLSPSSAHPSIYDRVTRVALVHVVAIEDLANAPNPSNGEQQ